MWSNGHRLHTSPPHTQSASLSSLHPLPPCVTPPIHSQPALKRLSTHASDITAGEVEALLKVRRGEGELAYVGTIWRSGCTPHCWILLDPPTTTIMHSHTSIHTFHTLAFTPSAHLCQAFPESDEVTLRFRGLVARLSPTTVLPLPLTPSCLHAPTQAIPESAEATQRFRRLVASTANYSAATHKALCAETQEHRVDLAFAVREGGRKGARGPCRGDAGASRGPGLRG